MKDARWRNRLIADAGMGMLLHMIGYKAARAGTLFVKVDPKYTLQDCSGCGAAVPTAPSMCVLRCLACGLELDRRENAARNVLHKAVAGLGELNVAGSGERAPGNIRPTTV